MSDSYAPTLADIRPTRLEVVGLRIVTALARMLERRMRHRAAVLQATPHEARAAAAEAQRDLIALRSLGMLP